MFQLSGYRSDACEALSTQRSITRRDDVRR